MDAGTKHADHYPSAGANFLFSMLFLTLVAGSWGALEAFGRLPQSLDDLAPWEMAILALAVFRFTRVITKEEVGEWIRALFPPEKGGALGRTAASLVRCPWCFGVWVAWLFTTAYLLIPYVAVFPLLVIAVAGAAVAVHTAVGALRAMIPPSQVQEERGSVPNACR